MSGLRPLARHAPNRDARVILLSLPRPGRVPPLIFLLTTMCLRLRSAALLSDGASGRGTKTNSSLMNRSMRRQSLTCGASGVRTRVQLINSEQLLIMSQFARGVHACSPMP